MNIYCSCNYDLQYLYSHIFQYNHRVLMEVQLPYGVETKQRTLQKSELFENKGE